MKKLIFVIFTMLLTLNSYADWDDTFRRIAIKEAKKNGTTEEFEFNKLKAWHERKEAEKKLIFSNRLQEIITHCDPNWSYSDKIAIAIANETLNMYLEDYAPLDQLNLCEVFWHENQGGGNFLDNLFDNHVNGVSTGCDRFSVGGCGVKPAVSIPLGCWLRVNKEEIINIFKRYGMVCCGNTGSEYGRGGDKSLNFRLPKAKYYTEDCDYLQYPN